MNYQSLHLLLSSSIAKDLPLSLYGLSHFCLFTISSVAMFVCISQLKNLVILLPTPKQEPKGFNTLSSHSKNSLKQC